MIYSTKGPVFAFRGVHAKHPMNTAALLGIVVPGDPTSDMTPVEHNTMNLSVSSPYTSWTYHYPLAFSFAKSRGPGGVVLRLQVESPGPDDLWEWVESPDFSQESEVLLKGSRIDAEVVEVTS